MGLFLNGKTKAEFIGLVHELPTKNPESKQGPIDRQLSTPDNVKTNVTGLRKEIRDMGDEPLRQNDLPAQTSTRDYTGIREKLEKLLHAGHADEVLTLGEELLHAGTRLLEESLDATEIRMAITDCLPVVVRALDQSSMAPAARLAWAMDAVLKDKVGLCGAFVQYLHRHHSEAAWNALAEHLLTQLKSSRPLKDAGHSRCHFARDRLSDWTIHALERAGRSGEIIPLCEAEAKATGSYDRLAARLMASGRYEDAENWIEEGVRSTKGKWGRIDPGLRDKLRDIRARQENWPMVAAIQVEKFVDQPSRSEFVACRKAASKVNRWEKVRACLLDYLDKGVLPWNQKGWPLPETGLDKPEGARTDVFPMVDRLIHIAIMENNPEQVLSWYDRLPRKGFGWYGLNEDEIATAVQAHSPDRAVAIWKKRAEELIAQVTPSAYRRAAKCLSKAGAIIGPRDRAKLWDQYLRGLRKNHPRKRRLIEILDGLEGKPSVKNKSSP